MKPEKIHWMVAVLLAIFSLGLTGCGGNDRNAPMSILDWRVDTGVHLWAHHVENGEFYVLKDTGVKLDLDAGTSGYVYNLQQYGYDTQEWSVELPVSESGTVIAEIFVGDDGARKIAVLHKSGLTHTLLVYDQSGALLQTAIFDGYNVDVEINDASGAVAILLNETPGFGSDAVTILYELVEGQLLQRAELARNYDMALYTDHGQWFVMSSTTLHGFTPQWQPQLMLDVSEDDLLGELYASENRLVISSRFQSRLYYVDPASASFSSLQNDAINELVGIGRDGNPYLHYKKDSGDYGVVKMDEAGTILYESSTNYGLLARVEATELLSGGVAVDTESYFADGQTTAHTSRVDILDDSGDLIRGYTLATHEKKKVSIGCAEWCKTEENQGYRVSTFFIQQNTDGEVTGIFTEGFRPFRHIGEIDLTQFDGAEETTP